MIKLDPDTGLAEPFDITCIHRNPYLRSNKINQNTLKKMHRCIRM